MNKNEYVVVSEGQSSERPSNPYDGYQYWNDQTNRLEVYKDGIWKNVYTTPEGEVIEGSPYITSIEEGQIVTMGGVDITSTMVHDGVLNIEEVSGDVKIEPTGGEGGSEEGE